MHADRRRCHWWMAAAMTTWSSLAHSVLDLFHFIQISDACFVHLLWQYFLHAVINWIWLANLEATVQMGYFFYSELLSGVSFSNNSVVVRERWAPQGIIIQPRWKLFNGFVANLFRTLRNKFQRSRPSFIEDITKTFWSFFPETNVFYYVFCLSFCLFKGGGNMSGSILSRDIISYTQCSEEL